MDKYLEAAIEQATLGLTEGGIPIGSVLVIGDQIVGRGRKRRIQIGENTTFTGPEEYLRSRGVSLSVVNDKHCNDLMRQFIATHPALWNEDIGEPDAG